MTAKKTKAVKKTKPAAKATKAKAKPSKPAASNRPPQSAPYSEGKWAGAFAPREPGERRYWLVKSEPETFSFDNLLALPNKTTGWDGVRNFVARNFMRDGMKKGDCVFFYHSSTNPQAIVGVCEVVRAGYPDPTALDKGHAHFDADSNPADPRWYQVDLKALEKLARPVTLQELKLEKALADMALLRIGRLSVTPVRAREWAIVIGMSRG
jgi:predicted RNA-binding protein with PUA-like domain